MLLVEIEIDGIDAELGQALEAACRDDDAWPVQFAPAREERRWFGLSKAYPASVEVPLRDAFGPMVEPTPTRDGDQLHLRPGVGARLAGTVERIARLTQRRFGLRITYADLPITADLEVSAAKLSDVLRSDTVDPRVRYVVVSRETGRARLAAAP